MINLMKLQSFFMEIWKELIEATNVEYFHFFEIRLFEFNLLFIIYL